MYQKHHLVGILLGASALLSGSAGAAEPLVDTRAARKN